MTTPTDSFAAFKTFAKFTLAVCLWTIRPGFADQQANPDHVLLQLDIQGSKVTQSHFFQIQSAENGSRQFIDVTGQASVAMARGHCGRIESATALTQQIQALLPGAYFRNIAVSPNAKWAIVSIRNAKANYRATELAHIDLEANKIVFRLDIGDELGISDLCWAPDSQSLGVVLNKTHTGLSPGNLLSAMAGHPVPYEDIFIGHFDIQSHRLSLFPQAIAANVKYGNGHLSWRFVKPD